MICVTPVTMAQCKRQPAMQLGEMRAMYDDQKSMLTRILKEDPALIDDNGGLYHLANDVKTSFSQYSETSKNLTEKLMNYGAPAEAQEVRSERLDHKSECKEILRLINCFLNIMGGDAVSSVGGSSVAPVVGETGNLLLEDRDDCSTLMGDFSAPHLANARVVADEPATSLPSASVPFLQGAASVVVDRAVGRPTVGYSSARPEVFPHSHSIFRPALADINLHTAVSGGGVTTTSETSAYNREFRVSERRDYGRGLFSTRFELPPLKTYVPKAETLSTSCGVNPRSFPYQPSYTKSDYDFKFNAPRMPGNDKVNSLLNMASGVGSGGLSDQNPYMHRDHRDGVGAGDVTAGGVSAIDVASQHLLRQELMRKSEEPFTGEPHKFNSWRMFLLNKMKNIRLDPMDIICILSSNTAGEPHKLVEQFKFAMGRNPQDTLNKIWDALVQKFGSPLRICTAISGKLESFPTIRPPNIKGKLSDLVDLCRIVDLNMIDNAELLVFNLSTGQHKIWSKLPEWLQQRWRSYGHDYTSRHGNQVPPFSVLLGFIEKQCDEMNNPFFQKSGLEDGFVKTGDTRVLRVESKETVGSDHCIYHQAGGHSIYDCKVFSKLSHYDKIGFAKKHKLCFNCLGNHMSTSCDTEKICEICNKSHCTIMHKKKRFDSNHRYDDRKQSYSEGTVEGSSSSLCISLCGSSSISKSCSKTLLCSVFFKHHPEKVIKCYVIIDEQSTSSFIDTGLAKALNVAGPTQEFTITTIAGLKTKHKGSVIKDLCIRGVKEKTTYNLPPLYTNNFIPDCRNEVASPDVVRAHPHVAHLARHYADYDPTADVLILLGRDAGELMKTRCYGSKHPYAHRTPLGWALVGSSCVPQGNSIDLSSHVDHEHYIVNKCIGNIGALSPLEDCFREHLDDEDLGPSQEDLQFISRIDTAIYINEGGFLTMPLPFKDIDVTLTNNEKAVYCRTRNTLNRLKCDKSMLRKCLEIMGKHLDKGHIEVVPEKEQVVQSGRGYWLPIFVVVHPKKRKPRLVFDSSAEYGGTSLNNELMQGPDDGNRLRGVLMRFRLGEVGFSADIESMFYNFYLPAGDRDFLRFHWFQGNDPERKLVQYRGCVHLFGNRPSPAIAQCGLRYAVDRNSDLSLTSSKSFISDNFYVDDGLGCARSADQAIGVLRGARAILDKYHIRLHKIISNDKTVIDAFPESELAEVPEDVAIEDKYLHKALGLTWNLDSDQLFITVDVPEKPFTRRGLLSIVGSIYDPLGVANPVTLRGKIIQREVLTQNKSNQGCQQSWDDELPLDCFRSWNSWRSSLVSLDQLKIPRSYLPSGFEEIAYRELHVFSDASEVAVGAVAYLKLVSCTGQVYSSYVISKSKLIQKTATSIPRAELCAAVEAALLCREISKELQIDINSINMYTDSMVVLGYLNNTQKRFTNYVTRRVHTILKLTTRDMWKYIASNLNPADLASRCCTVEVLLESVWLKGPEFLHHNISMEEPPGLVEELPEEKECVTMTASLSLDPPVSYIFSKTKSLDKAIRIAGIVMTFVYTVMDRVRLHRGESLAVRLHVGSEHALSMLVTSVQSQCFPELIKTLSCGRSTKDSVRASLNPFIDCDGIVRVGGRLKNSSLLGLQKHPILLPANHSFSHMVILYYHERTCHQGRHLTAGAIRLAGYHIERSSKTVKNIIKQCITCIKLRGQPTSQLMSDLPASRVEQVVPFHDTGLDVFGPFYVTDGKTTRRSAGSKKVWALLLTCMTSRAIHVEPLIGLDTSSLKNALRRFMAIRGTCKHLYSDCGTNFIGANNLDLRELNHPVVDQEYRWHFNVPHASHHGGPWERKVGSIRRILEATMLNLKNTLLSRDEFTTLLYEAMAIVNNTPLWGVSVDPNDPAPISPAMLLTLRDSSKSPSFQEFSDRDLLAYGKLRWKRVQYIADCFWQQWRSYYLSSLQERRKWKLEKRNFEVNDIVLLKDKNQGRNRWPTGIITAVKTGHDNLVRTVTVTVAVSTDKGHSFRKSFSRPISEVILLVPASEGD